nr:hypothetical protein Iba_chr10eCG9440 [Ipomoea batatas]
MTGSESDSWRFSSDQTHSPVVLHRDGARILWKRTSNRSSDPPVALPMGLLPSPRYVCESANSTARRTERPAFGTFRGEVEGYRNDNFIFLAEGSKNSRSV